MRLKAQPLHVSRAKSRAGGAEYVTVMQGIECTTVFKTVQGD